MSEETLSAFRTVPRTGVIYVTTEASKRGFQSGAADWCNLGQGQPETGPIEGSPPRVGSVSVNVDDLEYAPVAGLWELREQIASLYNQLFRRGMGSQYSAENVCLSGGGRAALARAAAAHGHLHLGPFLADYTAYEELLDIFKAFTAIPILLDGARGYTFTAEDLRREVLGKGLSAVLLSNPANPTGKVIEGEELRRWVEVASEVDCTLLLDEFYSHYVYGPATAPEAPPRIVSACEYVKDVDRDPVVVFDGFTKNWRYPGWRVTWAVGPKKVMEALASAGSFLDGGGSRPLQRAALPLVSVDYVHQETRAIQALFRKKRDRLLSGLRAIGVGIDCIPEGTFYVWGRLNGLPQPLRDGMAFFRRALEEKVICVPGEFFDVNPGKRRGGRSSRFRDYVRFSFGPSLQSLDTALQRLEKVVFSA